MAFILICIAWIVLMGISFFIAELIAYVFIEMWADLKKAKREFKEFLWDVEWKLKHH